ncbi:MAG: hypothetical protein JW882_15435 [Deltaproteobacteria bacterium]|nr:hypothetical protein [Deltaproteobacteria bacterium]
MIRILLVSPDRNYFTDFELVLNKNYDVETVLAETGENALKIVSDTEIDLVVTDEDLGDMTNLEFARRLIKLSPMINCASVSGLSHDAFHEASEGLGIMWQLPVNPGKTDAERMMERLQTLTRISLVRSGNCS